MFNVIALGKTVPCRDGSDQSLREIAETLHQQRQPEDALMPIKRRKPAIER